MQPPEVARNRARAAVAELRGVVPSLLVVEGIQLDSALEQQLFFAFRDQLPLDSAGSTAGVLRGHAVAVARALAAAAMSLAPRGPARVEAGRVAVLVRESIHLEVLDRIDGELTRLGALPTVRIVTGRAAARGAASRGRVSRGDDLRLSELLGPSLLRSYATFHGRLLASQGRTRRALSSVLDSDEVSLAVRVVVSEMPRIVLGALALASASARLRPSLFAAFDEVGTWARILPAVARAARIPSLDIPHAEAAVTSAIVGAGYDRMAVYGSRARSVLLAAGISEHRIVEVGAPRFDPLIADAHTGEPSTAPAGRVVYAAQYPAGALTEEVMAASYAAALAVATALRSELVVRLHPADAHGTMARVISRHPALQGVAVEVEGRKALVELLRGARVMVTAWSNSVFEAALLGVPALAVIPPGVRPPVDFVADGLAISARTPEEAAAAAEALSEGSAAKEAVARARRALDAHIGPLDGRASERVARLMLETIGRAPVEDGAA